KPTATGLASNLLPEEDGWSDTITEPGPGEIVWMATALFIKKGLNDDGSQNNNTELTTDNWTIQGTWSAVISLGNFDTGSGEGEGGGTPGETGATGWSPVLAVVSRIDGARVHQVVDWVNLDGAGEGTKPAAGYYLSGNGFVTNINQATNIRGEKGDPGQFDSNDFWLTNTYRISGSKGFPN